MSEVDVRFTVRHTGGARRAYFSPKLRKSSLGNGARGFAMYVEWLEDGDWPKDASNRNLYLTCRGLGQCFAVRPHATKLYVVDNPVVANAPDGANNYEDGQVIQGPGYCYLGGATNRRAQQAEDQTHAMFMGCEQHGIEITSAFAAGSPTSAPSATLIAAAANHEPVSLQVRIAFI